MQVWTVINYTVNQCCLIFRSLNLRLQYNAIGWPPLDEHFLETADHILTLVF